MGKMIGNMKGRSYVGKDSQKTRFRRDRRLAA